MLTADVALIGGTGIGYRLAELGGRPITVPTRYGPLRGTLVTYNPPDSDPVTLVLVQRHSAGHKDPPHKINFKAIARGLAELKVKGCVSTAASGCLNPAWPVGTVTVCTDFIDFTARNVTMFENEVEHHDFSDPFNLAPYLQDAASDLNYPATWPCTYLCLNGPRYETPAEIKMYGELGADLVGMTAATEAVCLRELEVPYGLLGIVTNPAAGISESPLSHSEVTEVMEKVGADVVKLMLRAAVTIAQSPPKV